LKKGNILNLLQSDLQEAGVSKLETAVSFYSLTPQKSAKIEGFFGNEIFNFLVHETEWMSSD